MTDILKLNINNKIYELTTFEIILNMSLDIVVCVFKTDLYYDKRNITT